MLSTSLEDGALYRYFDPESGGGDTEAMLDAAQELLGRGRRAVSDAWDESPRRSRLVHGVGIVSMGCLMDEIAYALGEDEIPSEEEFLCELGLIAKDCRWDKGSWKFGHGEQTCAWNELQNTPKDIVRLSDHLVNLYRRRNRRRDREAKAA